MHYTGQHITLLSILSFSVQSIVSNNILFSENNRHVFNKQYLDYYLKNFLNTSLEQEYNAFGKSANLEFLPATIL